MGYTETLAFHDPIYPSDSKPVTFFLKKINGEIESIKLYEKIQNISVDGIDISNQNEFTPLKEWKYDDIKNDTVKHQRKEPYQNGKFISYKFEIIGNNGQDAYNHIVHFEIQQDATIYSNDSPPIPIYLTNLSTGKPFNITFIPDVNIDLDSFYKSVLLQIKNTFFKEKTLNRFRHLFNFYINPLPAEPGDYNNPEHRKLPVNSDILYNMSDCNIILHNIDIAGRRDFNLEKYFGAKHNEYGTLLHEFGHVLNLSDEYIGGALDNAERNSIYKNIWKNKNELINYCRSTGVEESKIQSFTVGVSNPRTYYKLCSDSCNMHNAGKVGGAYDIACQNRIIYKFSESVELEKFDNNVDGSNLINQLNKFIETKILNTTQIYDKLKWKNTVQINDDFIKVDIKYKDGKLKLLNNNNIILEKKIKKNNLIGSKLYFDFLTNESKSILTDGIDNPFLIRSCYEGVTKIKFAKNTSFKLKIPINKEIKYVRLFGDKLNNKLAKQDDLKRLNVSKLLNKIMK